MGRARRDSIVSSIASHGGGLDFQNLPGLLDDSYLFDRLEKLSLALNDSPARETTSSNLSSTLGADDTSNLEDRYAKYTTYLGRIDSNVQQYEEILQQSQKVDNELVQAIEMFNNISSNTIDFVGKTQELHKEFRQISQLHEEIPKILQYFIALDPIMRRLNHASSANIVRKNSFKTMLSSIDQSLMFLEQHPDIKEAETYRIKFKRCLIRSSELIANYLSNLLRQTYDDITEKLSSSAGASLVSKEALLYNKFSSSSEEYYSQLIQIVSLVYNDNYRRYHDELESILNDCYNQYFQTRMKLLYPVIWLRLDETILQDRELSLVTFIQDGKSYFQQLCIDEYKLFIKFYPQQHSSNRVNQWLCQLCEPWYDCVRTRILRETEISMLCDSVTLFGQYYEFEEDSEEYSKRFHEVQYDKVFEPIVQKLQARLILRVQIYVQQNIINFTPSKDSFIISRRRKKTLNANEPAQNGMEDAIVEAYLDNLKYQNNDTEGNSRSENLELYYPPLIKALALLSKIYEMLNSAVFDDLAHHIVHDCIFSLRKAYNIVQSSPSGINNLDIKLSYLRNLLMLRQEIQNFNIRYTVNETYLDFSGVESFFIPGKGQDSSLLSRARGLVPKVVNNMVDARSELIIELRNIVKDFTDVVGRDLMEDTLQIASTTSLLTKNMKLRQNLEEKLPRIHAQICNFIDDDEIVVHLLDAIQETVIQRYSDFYGEVSLKAEKGILDKSEVSELMYEDVFADFLNNITISLCKDNNVDREK